jgi:hypothetical protein
LVDAIAREYGVLVNRYESTKRRFSPQLDALNSARRVIESCSVRETASSPLTYRASAAISPPTYEVSYKWSQLATDEQTPQSLSVRRDRSGNEQLWNVRPEPRWIAQLRMSAFVGPAELREDKPVFPLVTRKLTRTPAKSRIKAEWTRSEQLKRFRFGRLGNCNTPKHF